MRISVLLIVMGVIIAIAMSIGIIYVVIAFRCGVQALQRSWQHHDGMAITLRSLGLNLCEPLISSLFILVLWLFSRPDPFAPGQPVGFLIGVMLFPFVILVLPLLGLSYPRYRCINADVLGLGFSRLVLTVGFLSFLFTAGYLLLIAAPVCVLNTVLLRYSARWGQRLLAGPLA
ncbi:MAG: hypothetical protein HC837_01940 [Chloroflexaceae bacterium]|nr:hypothetical protein [Chloroflexaceae bacterium]